ncbi:FecR family protein [Thalassospira mesophila]|uniref:FecR family protein n=1 Tax=Thalassospira mesophila TaxID=1293891 RepID=UPI0013027886|nr:FecR family protein [Thalassospira mesophila]
MSKHTNGQDRDQGRDKKDISNTAIDWLVKLSSGHVSADMQQQYRNWLSQSRDHAVAMEEARLLLHGIGQTGAAQNWQADNEGAYRNIVSPRNAASPEPEATPRQNMPTATPGFGRDRRGSAPSDHDVQKHRTAHQHPGADAKMRKPISRMGRGAGALLASLVVLVCLTAGVIVPGMVGPVAGLFADYATGIGERRTVTLPDGTIVRLNTASALSVNYSPNRREVHLAAGEALFEVAKNPNRPFVVMAANGQARAVGTVYDVQLGDDGVHVGVREGIVAVSTGQSATRPVNVTAGQRVSYDGSGKLSGVISDGVDAQTAWMRGKLIFNRQPLSAVIAEIQRYRQGRIILANPDLAGLKVSGVFDLNDLDDLLKSIDDTTDAHVFSTMVATVIY